MTRQNKEITLFVINLKVFNRKHLFKKKIYINILEQNKNKVKMNYINNKNNNVNNYNITCFKWIYDCHQYAREKEVPELNKDILAQCSVKVRVTVPSGSTALILQTQRFCTL